MNENTLSDILIEVVNDMNSKGGTRKVTIKESFEVSDKGRKTELRLSDYINRLEWESPKDKITRESNINDLELLEKEKFVPDAILDRIGIDLEEDNLYQCIKIAPFIKEQGRKDNHDGIDKKKNIRSNIFWTFDIAKYKKLSNYKISKINLFEYAIWVIKVILFLDLKQVLNRGIEENPNVKYLITAVNQRINSSIVTGLVLSDTLTLKKYRFEDYYYELAKLNFKSKDSIVADSPNRQSLTFIFKELKNYPTIYSVQEQIELKKKREEKLNMTKAEYEANQILDAILDDSSDDLIAIDIEEDLDNNPFLEQDYGINLEQHYNFVYNIEPVLQENEEHWETDNKHNEKIKFRIVFQKGSNSQEIKISFKISGIDCINNLLFSEKQQDVKQQKPLVSILMDIADNDVLQEFFNQCLSTFFDSMVEAENNFKDITKSPFSLDVEFIEENINGRNYVIAKAILSVLASKSRLIKKEILSQLKQSSKDSLKALIAKLKKKNNRYQKEEKAISYLYKYYKDVQNA